MRKRVHGLLGLDTLTGQSARCQRHVLVVDSPVMRTADTPLGILADRWRRKRVLHLATWADRRRNSCLRELGAVVRGCAIAGITRGRPDGRLRRNGPATSVRTAANLLFAPPTSERWSGNIKLLARNRSGSLPGWACSTHDFRPPLAGNLGCLAAGIRRGRRPPACPVFTGHDDVGKPSTEMHYQGRSSWV